jgi:hypothetical protein
MSLKKENHLETRDLMGPRFGPFELTCDLEQEGFLSKRGHKLDPNGKVVWCPMEREAHRRLPRQI